MKFYAIRLKSSKTLNTQKLVDFIYGLFLI